MIVAAYVVHYGSDYIAYSIKSVYDHVDRIFINYASSPSHGQSSNLVNPDPKQNIVDAIRDVDPEHKIDVAEGTYANEGQHRDCAVHKYSNADIILTVDTDEIWDGETLDKCLKWVGTQQSYYYLMSFIHFWRSFGYIVTDEMMPVRFCKPKCAKGTTAYVPREFGHVYHFGYARKPDQINYKISCHGHKNEWRNEWYDEVFMKWPQNREMGDLHPTHAAPWKAKPYDRNQLPQVLHKHPYFDLDTI